ncbi:MAG TPA: hypothetical protein VN648_23955, partial [Candidatus Methylomirabilis sp.]|nr:hypothetical protein [Candidatus Methylomirabilis sp.]
MAETTQETAPTQPEQPPKAKKPFVMTPARLAAMRANIAKARRAPKEKVYRSTEKRQAANRANAAKGRAAQARKSAARRAEENARWESFFQRFASLFPPPPVGRGSRQPGPGPDGQPPGQERLREAAAGVWQRSGALGRTGRRLGRQVMRLLTQAARRSALGREEAMALLAGLLAVLHRAEGYGEAEGVQTQLSILWDELLLERYGKGACTLKSLAEWRAAETAYQALRAKERQDRRQDREVRQWEQRQAARQPEGALQQAAPAAAGPTQPRPRPV